LNGNTRQSGSSGDMIWSSAEIIAHISRLNRLEPGDVILTGTPAGVGPVLPGDQLVATVDGVPSITVECQPPKD
ncbi:MAG: fumarylacetoacetate hydrolase family protein, partial [Myxococcota bacterium]